MRTVTEVAKSIVITPIQMELEVKYNLLISHENREEKNINSGLWPSKIITHFCDPYIF